MDANTKHDCTYDWIVRNLPPEEVTLARYIALNWFAAKRLEDLEAEELSMLPKELYPEPASKLVQ